MTRCANTEALNEYERRQESLDSKERDDAIEVIVLTEQFAREQYPMEDMAAALAEWVENGGDTTLMTEYFSWLYSSDTKECPETVINNWMSALKAAKLQYAFRCINMRLSSGFDDLGSAEVAAGRDAELDSTSTFNQRTFGVWK